MDYKTKQKYIFYMHCIMWLVLAGITAYAFFNSKLVHASDVTDKQTVKLIKSLAKKPIGVNELKDIFYTTPMCSYGGTNSKGVELMVIHKPKGDVIVPLGKLPLTQIMIACVTQRKKPDVKSETRWARNDPRWKTFKARRVTGVVHCTQLLKHAKKDIKLRRSKEAADCRKVIRNEAKRR